MTIEVEAKIRLPDPALLHARLEQAEATLDGHLLETNTYFDSPDGTLKSTDQGLRIRIEVDETTGESRTLITHKGPRAHGTLKSRSETELGVTDAQAAARLLAVLGYREVMTFEKRRTRYLLDHCRVEIDTLPHLGTFIEIEGAREEDVLAVRDKLGLADAPLIRASYISMLVTHLREHAISGSNIRLEGAPVGAA